MSFISKLKEILIGAPKIKSILTASAITLQVPNRTKPFTMERSHSSFTELVKAVQNHDLSRVEEIINSAETVVRYTHGGVTIVNGLVFYKGQPVHGTLVTRILEAMNKNLPSKPLLMFLENLMQNPSEASKAELYDFLQAANIPVTSDGRFVAYKWVSKSWHDKHTGKTKHEIGGMITMPREHVNADRNQTCAAGLHVCGRGYDRFGEVLLLVAVNPKDVVSVPKDYNNHKMRVCAYQVIKEVKDNERYNKEDIIEANPIYFTKVREPEAVAVELPGKLPVGTEVTIEVTTPPVSPKETVTVTIPLEKSVTKVIIPKLTSEEQAGILRDIKNKRGKLAIMTKYGLNELQYDTIKSSVKKG